MQLVGDDTVLARGVDQQVCPCRDIRRREGPEGEFIPVVGQVPPRKVDRGRGGVVQLDPVRRHPHGIGNDRVVRRHELPDRDLGEGGERSREGKSGDKG